MPATILPTRSLGSLGLTKVNAHAVVDPYRDEDASEANLIRDLLVELFDRIGLSAGWSDGTIADWIDRLTNREMFFIREWGEGAGLHPRWDPGGLVLPTTSATLSGGLVFALDNDVLAQIPGDQFDATQDPRFAFDATLNDPPGGDFHAFVGFIDGATGKEGWGVIFCRTGTKVQGFTRTGGVNTTTDLGTYTPGNVSTIDAYLSGGNLFVSLDGATAVDCGAVPAAAVSFLIQTAIGGAAGKIMTVRRLRLMADWS